MSTQTPMTPRGHRLLRERLDNLKKVERPQNIEDIEVARAHGDLSENAEYKYAKQRQGEIDGQIRFLEARLATAQIIDVTRHKSDTVIFGATVDLVDLDTQEELTYMIVGESEANIKMGLLNVGSPLAAGLIGKEEGDEVVVQTPGGKRRFEIIELRFDGELPDVSSQDGDGDED